MIQQPLAFRICMYLHNGQMGLGQENALVEVVVAVVTVRDIIHNRRHVRRLKDARAHRRSLNAVLQQERLEAHKAFSERRGCATAVFIREEKEIALDQAVDYRQQNRCLERGEFSLFAKRVQVHVHVQKHVNRRCLLPRRRRRQRRVRRKCKNRLHILTTRFRFMDGRQLRHLDFRHKSPRQVVRHVIRNENDEIAKRRDL